MIPLQLNEECLHTLSNAVLTLSHEVRHGLVHFYNFGLTGR